MKVKKRQFPDQLLTVDTGENTGLALWEGTKYPDVSFFKVKNPKLNHESKLIDLWEKFDSYICRVISEDMNCKTIKLCILEIPELWGDSSISLTAAKRGNLFYLSGIAHGYACVCNQYNINFRLIEAKRWKGQLSKVATKEWVYRINHTKYKNDHITDAVAMGFSYIGWQNAFQLSRR